MAIFRTSLLTTLLLGSALAQGEVPPWQLTETPFGPLKLREFGPKDGPLVVAFHGMMNNDFIRDEWVLTAQKLAIDGFHVLLPDFHSGPDALRPGSMTGEDARTLVADLALHQNEFVPMRYRATVKPKIAVMGKSWGAKMAAEAGALEQVVATVLVVPAIASDDAKRILPAIHGQVALLMVADDTTAPISRSTEYKQLLERVTWFRAERGGHRVLPEFVDPITTFMGKVRGDFLHGPGEEATEL